MEINSAEAIRLRNQETLERYFAAGNDDYDLVMSMMADDVVKIVPFTPFTSTARGEYHTRRWKREMAKWKEAGSGVFRGGYVKVLKIHPTMDPCMFFVEGTPMEGDKCKGFFLYSFHFNADGLIDEYREFHNPMEGPQPPKDFVYTPPVD